MKRIITITASVLTLITVIFGVLLAARSRKVSRKPTMTFRELLRDNANVDFKCLFGDT